MIAITTAIQTMTQITVAAFAPMLNVFPFAQWLKIPPPFA
jgi:hypothetical protein